MTLTVQDQGIGIADDELEQIFDRLYRSRDERVQALSGGGLRPRTPGMVVESPVGVNIPAGTPHSQRIIEGAGHFFNFVPKSFYNDGLMS